MTEKQDEIRLKELLSVFGKDRQKEIIEILHRDQIRYHKEQLRLYRVSKSFYCNNEVIGLKTQCNKQCKECRDWIKTAFKQ